MSGSRRSLYWTHCSSIWVLMLDRKKSSVISEQCMYRGHRNQEMMPCQSLNLSDYDRQKMFRTGQRSMTIDERWTQIPQQNSLKQASASELKYWQHGQFNDNLNSFVLSDPYTSNLERISSYDTDLYEMSSDGVSVRQRVTAVWIRQSGIADFAIVSQMLGTGPGIFRARSAQ